MGAPSIPVRVLDLPGRGTSRFVDLGSPDATSTVVLLHGWTGTSLLNWLALFDPLSSHHRVIAPDLRGHGYGPNDGRRFTLEHAADDVAALLDALDVKPVTLVGYSMGGAVAQLVVKRRPELVDALVLASTADLFCTTSEEQQTFDMLALHATWLRRVPKGVRRWMGGKVLRRYMRDDQEITNWFTGELGSHDPARLAEAGQALGRFDGRNFTPQIDIPTAFIMTLHDGVVPLARQRDMVERLPNPTVIPIGANHGAPLNDAPAFSRALLMGIDAVEAERDHRVRPEHTSLRSLDRGVGRSGTPAPAARQWTPAIDDVDDDALTLAIQPLGIDEAPTP